MNQYQITDSETGQVITVEGDSPPTEQEIIDIMAQVRGQAQPSQEATQVPMNRADVIARGTGNPAVPVLLGAGEVALEAATGYAGLLAGGYKGIFNMLSGEDFADQGKQVASILDSVGYQTKTRSAADIKNVLGGISRAAMQQPSMLYAGIKSDFNFITGEEKEAIAAQAEMDQEAFKQNPFQTIGDDTLAVTGSPLAAAAVDTALMTLSMMLGANSPRQISKIRSQRNKAKDIERFQLKLVNNKLDPTSEIDPTTQLVQFNRDSNKIESISSWELVNNDTVSPVQRAELGAYITKNKPAADAVRAGMSQPHIALFGGLSPTDSRSALRMLDIVKKSKASPLFAGKNRTTDIVGNGIIERYRTLKAVNTVAGRDLRNVIKTEGQTPVVFDSAIANFQRSLNDEGITLQANADGVSVNYGNSAMGESPEAVRIMDGIVNRLSSKGGQTLQEGHFLKKYIDENTGLQKVSEGLTGNSKRIIGNLRRGINNSMRQASPNYADANIRFSDTIEVIKELQGLAGSKIDLDGPNSRSALGTAFRGMLSNRQTRTAQVNLIGKMDKITGKYGATFNDSIYDQMIVASELEKMFKLAPINSFQGQTAAGVGSGILDMTIDPTMAGARAGAGILDRTISRLKGDQEGKAIKAIEQMLTEQSK